MAKQAKDQAAVTTAVFTTNSMYNLVQHKLWRKEYQNDAEPIQIQVKTYPFNHEAFYEARRNEIAIAAGKAYENITKAKIMHEQTALRHTYYLYLGGNCSEAEFKEYAEEALMIVAALMDEERALAD